jgi:hypothetical protein
MTDASLKGRLMEGKGMITKRNSLAMPFLLLTAIVFVLSFTASAHAQEVQVDLSSTSDLCGGQECFNVAGLFTTGTQFLGTNGMDDGNNCTPTAPYTNCPDAYSSNQLGLSSTTPPTLTPPSLNVPFSFGPVNTANCGPSTSTACTVDVVNLTTSGVEITLPTAEQTIYSTLIMLGTAVNGHHSGQVTIGYTTGAPDVFAQGFSDWCSFGGNQYESVAVGGIKRINSDGTLNGANCNVYAYTYPLDYTRSLQSITLTDKDGSGAMFGLAITLKPPTYTIDGGIANPTSVASGSMSTATVTVNPQPGYVGTVTLSCSISPTIIGDPPSAATAPSCSLSPSSVTVTAGETSAPTTTLTFMSAAPASSAVRVSTRLFYAFLLPVSGLALFGLGVGPRGARRKRWMGFWFIGILLALLILTPACVSRVHEGNVGTPPGQYSIAVTGVDTNGLSQASNPAGTSNVVTVNVTDN